MHYIAKRSTSLEKMEIFQSRGISLCRYDLPLELELIHQGTLPEVICSFGSTVLKTLPILFDGIDYYLLDASGVFGKSDKIEVMDSSKLFWSAKNGKMLRIDKDGCFLA